MRLDLILFWKTRNYQKVIFAEFENVFMCLMTFFFAIIKDCIIQNLFQKLIIFKTEGSSSEILDCQ